MSKIEQDSVEACIERMRAAWDARDAKTYASEFTDSATNITFYGDAVFSRAEIEEKLASIFTVIPRDLTMTIKVISVVEISENTRSVVTIAGVGVDKPYPLDKIQTQIFVRSQDRWFCAAFQNTKMSEDTEKFYNPASSA